MCVNALRDSFKRMAKNKLDNSSVNVGGVEHTGKRMPAFVRRVLHAVLLHDWVEDSAAKAVVAVTAAIFAAAEIETVGLQGFFVPRQNLARYGDDAVLAGLCFAVSDDENPAPKLDVSLADMTELADTAARHHEHQHEADAPIIGCTPKLVSLSYGEGLLLMQFLWLIDVQITGIIFDDQVIAQGVLIELFEQRADFLLCRIAAASAAHVVNHKVEMA